MANPLRCLVLFFNLLFFIFGLILLGIGIWGELTLGDYFEVTILNDYGVNTGPRLLIAVGAIVTFVSFFGCCGAWKENRCMLIIFLVLLLILLILEIAAAAMAYKNKDKIKIDLEGEIRGKMKNYKKGENKDIDDLQEKLKCCGVNSYQDWKINIALQLNNSVPDSCCKNMTDGCGKGLLNPQNNSTLENINEGGCYKIILDDSEKIMAAVGGLSIALLVIQILGMIFALVLIIRLGKSEKIN